MCFKGWVHVVVEGIIYTVLMFIVFPLFSLSSSPCESVIF